MFPYDSIGLGLLLIAIGVTCFLAVRAILGAASRARPNYQAAALAADEMLPSHEDAVLVVETGGRIQAINPRARQIFHLQEGEVPSLERLARKVRPSEALLKLSAVEGQARFVLDGRLVEGTSYRFAGEPGSPVLVSMRYPEFASGLKGEGGVNAQTLVTFTRLAQEIAASLDLEETIRAVLANVEKLISADFMELTLWDSDSESFIPYRFTGLAGVDRNLEKARYQYPMHGSFAGYLFQERVPLVISDINQRPDLRPALDHLTYPARSFLGYPLMVGNEFIGTLELSSMAVDSFHDEDLELVRLLSGQAAVALHNALLYELEQKRTAELSGLAQLAQAFGSVRDPHSLFSHLVESIHPLFSVNILGFLIYNENQRVLEGRVPFHGLPDQFVQLYRAQILPGSRAENVLIDQDVLITEDASSDEKWVMLGLDHLAQAASLRETVLLPLTTGGHMLGYLQASNHKDGPAPFTQGEMHLLTIVANQTASIIENAALVQQSRQRAQRAEALRRLSSLAGSAATLDEILQYSLHELARLLRADIAAVFLSDQDRGVLELHRASVFSTGEELPDRLTRILVDDPQFPFTVTGSQHVLTVGQVSLGSRAIVPFYQSIFEHWQVESIVAVPLVIRNEGIGELWFGAKTADFFEQGDVQVVATAAGQLAGVVEQSFLRSQTDESLRRRVDQMTAITRISRELSRSLDLNYLLQLVYDEALRTTGAHCGTILLFKLDEAQAEAVPAIRFSVGDPVEPALTSLLQAAIAQDGPFRMDDFSRSDFQPPHEDIQSMLVVPISYQQRRAGLICLHGRRDNQFDETAEEITLSLAVQAAVALNNALAYDEQSRRGALLKRELETLSHLIRVSRTLRPTQTLQQALTTIAKAIQSATPFDMVVISVYDPALDALRRIVGVGLAQQVWYELCTHTQPWRAITQFFQPQYQIGEAYYVPHDKLPSIPEDVHTVQVMPSPVDESADAWHPDDMLLVPLYDSAGNPLGMISVDAPRDHRRPDRTAFDALELFANQTSLAIEGHQRTASLEERLAELESEKKRLEQAAAQARSSLPVLLHKELEQSIALHGLNQRVERVRASLEIAAQANRQDTQEDVLHTLASELLTRFAMQVALIAERTPAGTRLVQVIGSLPAGVNPEALFGQRNPLRHMLQIFRRNPENALLLVSTLENAPEWQNCSLLNALEARSLIGLALDLGSDQAYAVLAVGQRALPAFLDEDRRVFAQLAHQVSVGLQNLQLLTEMRRHLREVNLLLDFSRKLGSLEPGDILNALLQNVAQVVPTADSGWVGMWEEKEQAIVPLAAMGYASREDILGIRYGLKTSSGEHVDTRVVLPLRVFSTGQPERVAEINFARQYQLGADDLLRYRRATNGRLPISALLIPLQIGDSTLGVLVFENFTTQGAFSEEDETLAHSFTRQAAMALENARLYQASEQRASQLQALTEVAGTITSSLRRDQLITLLLDQLKQVLSYNTATLWLRKGDTLTVAAAAGFADNDLRLNLSVAVEDSALFKAMIQTTQPVSVGDLRNDPRFPSLIEPENLSWLGIPLIYKSEVMGLIALEKREADFYTPEMIQAATAFASQAAVALENARLFEESSNRAAELDERSQRLALLNQLSGELVASLDAEHIILFTAQQLRTALDTTGVAVVMVDAQGQYSLHAEAPARSAGLPQALPDVPLFDHLRQSHGVFLTSDVTGEAGLDPLRPVFLQSREVHALMVVPLISGSELQGWFLVYNDQEYRYSSSEIELARTVCNQSAIALQNARLFAETRRLTEDLERRVEERTRELRHEHKNTQTLLHIITELSTSLDMSLVLNRTLAVLNDSLGSEESLIILSNSSAQYRAGIPLVDMQAAGKSQPVERQIAQWVIRSRQPLVISRVQDEGRWDIPEGVTLAYQSVLSVPLVMGEEVLGALLLFNRQENVFNTGQLGLMEATARQIGIALNNAELFNLIRDQSEHLGNMLREQQIEASRSRAILEAVADGVLVTDANGHINLFNDSAERILGLTTDQVMGKQLDQFVDVFARTGSAWMQTILEWSRNPTAYKDDVSFAEQLDLENGRVIAVHLAPVFWRNEFLGTVSIVRDITHEVQVDRLKSEFVANVSHELRTPMTSIKGYVEIMLMGAAGPLNPQQDHFLKIVKSNTERLSVLVNDLLDVSRIEAGRVKLNLQPLDLREIAEDVVADLQRRSREENKPMAFVVNIPASLPKAHGDLERVRQVLGNLVSNGYNYTPENGCVIIHMHNLGNEIQVDVIDNGIGIELSEQHRIFERFYRGEDPLVLATAGTGLGLAIARTLIEMHKGRIWFESTGIRGEGSTFSFTLPVDEAQE